MENTTAYANRMLLLILLMLMLAVLVVLVVLASPRPLVQSVLPQGQRQAYPTTRTMRGKPSLHRAAQIQRRPQRQRQRQQ